MSVPGFLGKYFFSCFVDFFVHFWIYCSATYALFTFKKHIRVARWYIGIPGVDVMITIFCDFRQFSAKKLAFFSKTNVMIKVLHNLALF
jgi:hypothetical protein